MKFSMMKLIKDFTINDNPSNSPSFVTEKILGINVPNLTVVNNSKLCNIQPLKIVSIADRDGHIEVIDYPLYQPGTRPWLLFNAVTHAGGGFHFVSDGEVIYEYHHIGNYVRNNYWQFSEQDKLMVNVAITESIKKVFGDGT